ncbi:MAG: hypothetical protein LH616_13415, partial [Ilumatobacteraceae bacterium]|nr:hypothetical protein [Ilumatobacteraceae bacterium]
MSYTTTDELLSVLWDARGSDLLLTVGVPPLVRVDGALSPVAGQEPLESQDVKRLLSEVMTPAQQELFSHAHEFDFSFGWREHARIRGNAFLQKGEIAVALRMIPRDIPSMDDLG